MSASKINYCAICGQPVLPNQAKATHIEEGWGNDDVSYDTIDVAHRSCAKQDMAVGMNYWMWNGKEVACSA